MPPKKKAARGVASSGPRRRSSRNKRVEEDQVPPVYQEMLYEAANSPYGVTSDNDRALKRRRVETKASVSGAQAEDNSAVETPTLHSDILISTPKTPVPAQQTVYDDLPSSDESDIEFEDVDLDEGAEADHHMEAQDEPLRIDLVQRTENKEKPTTPRRKPATSAEKKVRLDVHKWHVLCLLLHVHWRNRWCDSQVVQETLKPLVPRKTIALLHIDESKTQFQRNHGFMKAIEEICNIWKNEWVINAKGIRRAFWSDSADVMRDLDDAEDPIDFDDFKQAARLRAGSRDLGAQLFCALLRSLAVDTRLVCSLQPLPFSGVAKGMMTEKPKPEYIYASELQSGAESSEAQHSRNESLPQSHSSAPQRKKRIKDSPYPIFWVEVFSEAIQKWIPVDSLVRHTINKSKTGFEPPANDHLNSMSYVIAFEDDGSAKDVTRRYALHYNAKTRKSRVEISKGGEKWWKVTMKFFEKPFAEDRVEIEKAELAAREAAEPMPRNIQDFKDHPHYALERHLRRNEIIHPLREAGKVSTGPAKDSKLESIYRRRDVHVVRSADQWYRKGRDVRLGEQPLKRVVLRKRDTMVDMDEDENEDEGTGLYAEFQTELYIPPNVVDGRIPRNAYGNLDVYLPSMIPAGAIHIQHPAAARAAKMLGVNYADAVTGFNFRGRQGTAIINGIVAASEYREALVEVLRGIQSEQAESTQEKRSLLALQMWKRFLTALRIRDKLHKEYANPSSEEEDYAPNKQERTEEDDDDDDDDEGGGGFVSEADIVTDTFMPVKPPDVFPSEPYDVSLFQEIIVVESPHRLKRAVRGDLAAQARIGSAGTDAMSGHEAGGFIYDEGQDQESGGFTKDDFAGQAEESGGFIKDDAVPDLDENSGGFFPEDESTEEGGFLREQSSQVEEHTDTVASVSTSPPVKPTPADDLPVTVQSPKDDDLPSEPPPGLEASSKGANPKSDKSQDSTDHSLLHKSANSSDEDFEVPDALQSGDDRSMLSHDPDDEDAEPDWLLDD